jgi:filamentous hemagglutinin
VASAATAALALCAVSGTAAAATTSTAAVGRGTSSLTVLDLGVGGHQISLAELSLISDTIASPRVSSVSVAPVIVDGVAYGKQTINQSSSPKSVGGVSAPSAIAPFAQLTSPVINLSATNGPSNQAGTSSLGTAKVLGMPVSLAGALQAASAVSSTAGASGTKTVTLKNLALPSINDVLAALGLNLSALPTGTLDDLVSQLELVNVAITNAEDAVDTAQDAVDDAQAALATKQAALATATSTFNTAAAALTSLITANSTLLTPLGITDITTLLGASSTDLGLAETAVPTLAGALTTYTDANAAMDAAQGLVDTAQGLVTTVTATLTGALSTLKGLLTGVLDSTPLVSVGSLEVATRAVASSAAKGGQHAEVVGGVVKGLKVMGVDVLDAALGSSTLDLTGTITTKLAEVNGVIADVTGTLSGVLSNVPGLPALDIPAPVVGLLTKSAKTSISDGFGRATTTVHGLSISLPKITLPTSVAVPGAAALPGLAGVDQVAGLLSSAPLSIDMLTLHDQAAFRPATVGTSGTPGKNGGKNLAGTGLPTGVATLALLLVGSALVMRRRFFVTV